MARPDDEHPDSMASPLHELIPRALLAHLRDTVNTIK